MVQVNKQAWVCSNCGLRRTFHRTARVHNCQQTGRFVVMWHGIWRRGPDNNYPRISVLPPLDPRWVLGTDRKADYLIGFRTGVLHINVTEPQPFTE